MRYKVFTTKGYRSSYKRVFRHKHFDEKLLNTIINTLANGEELPARFRDHQLIGSLKEYRECHIKNDLLLVYQKQDDLIVLTLVDIGTHSDLFG
jgi:mRNA interferase YafQ